MRRNRPLVIAVAFLSIFTLAIAATVLESTTITSSYEISSENGRGSGPFVGNVLYLLVSALLELLGIELEFTGPVSVPPFGLERLAGAVTGLGSIALSVLVGAVAVTLLIARGRAPKSEHVSVVSVLKTLFGTPERTAQSSSPADRWPPAEPDDEVSEAWVAMTTRLEVEVDHPHARTPREWADTAIDAGFDADAVAALTDLFEETRYGGTTETTDRGRRAARERRRLEGDLE